MDVIVKFCNTTEAVNKKIKKKLVDLINTRICEYYGRIFGEDRAEVSQNVLSYYVNNRVKIEQVEKFGKTEEQHLVKISFHPADYIELTLLPSKSLLSSVDDDLILFLMFGAFVSSGIGSVFSFSLIARQYFSAGHVQLPPATRLLSNILPVIGAAFGGHISAGIFSIQSHLPYGIDLFATGAALLYPSDTAERLFFSPILALIGGAYTFGRIANHAKVLYEMSKRKDECSVLNLVPYLPGIEGDVSICNEDDSSTCFTASIKMDL